jgi:hypothetical protein
MMMTIMQSRARMMNSAMTMTMMRSTQMSSTLTTSARRKRTVRRNHR